MTDNPSNLGNYVTADTRPGTVICLIMTDGMENASREWSWDQVKALITQQREKYSWSFLFLGANIDAVQIGSRIGIPFATSMTYSTDAHGVSAAYEAAGRQMADRRSGHQIAFTNEDRKQASRGPR